jgi:2,3-bisphosphoglycerate-independent phosphoglycerate mutase
MRQYDSSIEAAVVYTDEELVNTFGEVVSRAGLKQLRTAETEKYAHVTFFFNGGKEAQYEGEERKLVPSPKVATYDLKPEMSAYEVTEALVEALENDLYDVVVVNLANPDMVGHTGVYEAAKKAVEVVDECLGKVAAKVIEKDGALLVTADHGNVDLMEDPTTHVPFTAHTTNDVPFLLVSNKFKNSTVKDGKLADLAPTMLDILGIEKPAEMTGETLIVK